MAKASQYGCIVCVNAGFAEPFEVPIDHTSMHHLDGKTKPGAHLLTIPLCPAHHQHGPTARHVNKKRFEQLYGKEYDLLSQIKHIIGWVD